VRTYLDDYGVRYVIDHRLVRGLDYYTRTTWEFVGPEERAQSSMSGGGRYDYLVEEIGGPPTPGVGFGAGIERLHLSLGDAPAAPESIEVFFVVEDPARRSEVLQVMAKLRAEGRSSDADYAGRSVKGQLTQAQRLGAATIVIAHERGFTVRRRGEQDVEAPSADELAL
jgi:histidyl-tRNA synthetase